jgi:hypothetical protein
VVASTSPAPAVVRAAVDEVGDGCGLGDRGGVRSVDLDGSRLRAGGHEAHGVGRDGQVLPGHHRPGRDRLPGRLGGAILERGRGDRPLRDRQQFGDLRRDVSGEDLVELVLLDVEVGAGRAIGERERLRVQRGAELRARELRGELSGALADVQVEAGDVHERRDIGRAIRGLGHDRAAVGVAGDDDRARQAVKDAAQVRGVVLEAAQRVRDGDDRVAAAVEPGDHAVPAG